MLSSVPKCGKHCGHKCMFRASFRWILQEAFLPSSLLVSWLHAHPHCTVVDSFAPPQVGASCTLALSFSFSLSRFPAFVAVAWRILFGLGRPPVCICDLSGGGAQHQLVPNCLPISLRGVAQLWPPACPCTVLIWLCDNPHALRDLMGSLFSPRIPLLLTDLDFLVVIFRRSAPREF